MRLVTDRLELRPFRAEDVGEMLELELALSKTELAAYDFSWPLDPAGMEEAVRRLSEQPRYAAICLREGRLIGLTRLAPKGWRWFPTYDMGYAVNPAYWNCGYATEACAALVKHAFTDKRARVLTAGSVRENLPSCRVLEKLGFQQYGTTPMAFRRDEEGRPIVFQGLLFRLKRDEWNRMSGR